MLSRLRGRGGLTEESGLQGGADIAGTWGCGDHRVGGVAWEEGSEEVLPAEQGEFMLNRQEFRLVVEVVLGRHEDGPGGDSEGGVLHCLEGLEGTGTGVGEPDWGGIGNEGLDEGFVGDQQGFPRLSPTDAGQGSHDVEP